MSTKKGEKAPKTDARASKTAELALRCDNALSFTLTLPMAMRAVGYSDEETQNRTLQMQVRRAMNTLNGGGNVNGRPASASEVAEAASAMMTLATGATNEGGATITADNETISPLKKIRKTSHQIQIERQNQKKIKDIQSCNIPCCHREDERGGCSTHNDTGH